MSGNGGVYVCVAGGAVRGGQLWLSSRNRLCDSKLDVSGGKSLRVVFGC